MSTFSTAQRSATATVITFGAEVLGGAEALELATLVRQACSAEGSTVVFDLAAVRVMNSSGLGMLVGALSTVKQHNSNLVLAAVPEKVDQLLMITQLNTVFAVTATVDEAVGE